MCRRTKPATLVAILALAAALAGCGLTDPYQQPAKTTSNPTPSTSPPQNPGESPAPAPPTAASQNPASVRSTPQAALAQFAGLYVNWSWRTLTSQQRQLASISVGSARLTEQQAAASSTRDSEIAQGRLYNRGQIVSIAPSAADRSEWVIVTREQTGGNSQYLGLQASYHVTLARLTAVPGGYAVSLWEPQT